MKLADILHPPRDVLVKIGTIAVYAEEMLQSDGSRDHTVTLQQLFNDPAVRDWLAAMTKIQMVPQKRQG